MPTHKVTHLDGRAFGGLNYGPASKPGKITLLAGSFLTINLTKKAPANIASNYRSAASHFGNGDIRDLPDGTKTVIRNIPGLSLSAARVFVDGKSGSGWKAWRLEGGDLIDSLRSKGAPKPPKSTPASPVGGLPRTPPPKLPAGSTINDIIETLVAWIHLDPFQRTKSNGSPRPGAPIVTGWDARLREYAYARSPVSNFNKVYADTAPLKAGLRRIINNYNWATVLAGADLTAADQIPLQTLAAAVCQWGGVPQRNGYAAAWSVLKSAAMGTRQNSAPMNSGWTKVASFATDGLPSSQTIWDSRVATSLIWRLDQILNTNGLTQAEAHRVAATYPKIGRVQGRRRGSVRLLNFVWPLGYGRWESHFGGSALVRDIVTILNDPRNGYPRMPQPTGAAMDWDVFGVGLVLFMDGY